VSASGLEAATNSQKADEAEQQQPNGENDQEPPQCRGVYQLEHADTTTSSAQRRAHVREQGALVGESSSLQRELIRVECHPSSVVAVGGFVSSEAQRNRPCPEL
jgi:hypothetical protein